MHGDFPKGAKGPRFSRTEYSDDFRFVFIEVKEVVCRF